MLNVIYKNKIGRKIRPILTSYYLSKCAGFLVNTWLSRFFINFFIKNHNIKLDEFIVPEGGYKTFNEFFYRKLSEQGTQNRPIDQDKNTVTSMADCQVYAIQSLNPGQDFLVKNCKFNLETFLQDKNLAREYENGTLILFRLRPQDYHRFHFPFDCTPSKPILIAGKYESVNPVAYTPKVMPLQENERQLVTLKSDIFGDVLCVIIGALLVGKINTTFRPTTPVKKGDEMGYFAFGASSLVLLFRPDTMQLDPDISQNSANNIETEIKMGRPVAKSIIN